MPFLGSKKPHFFRVRLFENPSWQGMENLDNSILRAIRLPVNWKNLNR